MSVSQITVLWMYFKAFSTLRTFKIACFILFKKIRVQYKECFIPVIMTKRKYKNNVVAVCLSLPEIMFRTYIQHLLRLLSCFVVRCSDAQVVLVILTVHVFMNGLKIKHMRSGLLSRKSKSILQQIYCMRDSACVTRQRMQLVSSQSSQWNSLTSSS